MGFNDRLEDDGYSEFLQHLVDNEHLDGSANGITKKVINEGVDSLTSKQKWVFDKGIEEYITGECKRGCNIPWSEMYDAYHNGGLCSYCLHMLGRADNE